jgi:alpha-L-glutamate ligase-like protein
MPVDFTKLEAVLGINRRNIELIGKLNPRTSFPVVDNKVLTKRVLNGGGVPTAETLGIIENFTQIEEVIDRLTPLSEFVVKPARGRAGGGILLLEKTDRDVWKTPSGTEVSREALRKHAADILFGVYSFGRTDDAVLIEERIVPNPFFKEIYGNGIADVRIITLDNDPVVAMARIPTSKSDGKANIHQGALGVAIELATGITTHAAAFGKPIDAHPDTDHPILGLRIPLWDRIVEISEVASELVDLGYIGVDIVVDERRGPLVLELNARPGLQIQVVNGKGLMPMLEGKLS